MRYKPIKGFSLGLLGFLIILIVIELYVGAGWFSSQAVFQVSRQEIVNEAGQNLVPHTKASENSFYETYSFNVLKESISDQDQQIYMLIYYDLNNDLDVYLNQKLINNHENKLNFNIVNDEGLLIIPIDLEAFNESNSYRLIMGSKYLAGLYGDVYFVNEDVLLNIERLIAISHSIKSFILYASIMLAIGFLGFTKIVVSDTDPKRAKAYEYLAVSVLFFVLQCSSIFSRLYINNHWMLAQTFQGIMFIIALLIFTIALYVHIKDRLMFKLCSFQLALTIISIPLFIVVSDGLIMIQIIKFLILLVTIINASIYLESPILADRTYSKMNIRLVLAFILFGQLLLAINSYMNIIPINVISVISNIVPLAVVMTVLLTVVFTELTEIRIKNEVERIRLKNLNSNIFEYVSEGVFSISSNLIVNDMYTKVCKDIFGKDLSGTQISYLLEDDETSVEFLERLFKGLFLGKIPWEAGVELLPTELILKDKVYKMDYQRILIEEHLSEIIVKVSDQTNTRDLQKKLLYERDKLALSITSVMNREELLPLVNEFIAFMEELDTTSEKKADLLNTIHTYKGNFGIFSFIHVVSALHELESKLLKEKSIETKDVSVVVDELYKDLEIITEITGSSFFEDTVYLKANVNNLESVYAEVKKYFYETEASLIIVIIKKIFNKSMKDIVLFYGREARKKAKEAGKEIKTITVVGDDIFIDYNYYKSALRSLVHIFNNCIDHGIEDEEERLALGKPRFGEINCRISDYGNFFEIIIKDDGRGIALDHLADRLIEKGLLRQEELDQLSEEELMEYVFLGEVTTQEEASLTSGRGVGLASVKDEVEKVGGEIRIVSFADFGTEVKVLLPKANETLISYFSLPLLMDLYVEAFKIYVKTNNIFELPLNILGSEKISEVYEYNVKIKFEGPEVGYFFMSCNKNVLMKLAYYLTGDLNLSEDEFMEVSWEVIKETCNIVSGNSTSIFDLNSKYINILSPDEIDKETFDEKNLVYSWHMKYLEYGVILGLIID